jgi:putative DNA methylase
VSVDELARTADRRSAVAAARRVQERLIDHWFPVAAVDDAVRSPAGSGLAEKALFTWFASRPTAQARAAVLTTLLPNDESVHEDVVAALAGSADALQRLQTVIIDEFDGQSPVVLDLFSGRGIIPLEATRCGARAVGTDLSPVATLGGRLLADYPFRDWNDEPTLPFSSGSDGGLFRSDEPRLLRDVRSVLAEVDRRTASAVEPLFPRNADGRFPWAYLWSVTIPCDQCRRIFPLVGSLVLRHPYMRTEDLGQALRLVVEGDSWRTEVVDGQPDQRPPLAAIPGRKGKTARCPFCQHTHSLDVIKAKGNNGQFGDSLVAVADGDDTPKKIFRAPRQEELLAASSADPSGLPRVGPFSAVPDEAIPPNNVNTVEALSYGYRCYGDLMNPRQQVYFASLVSNIRAVQADLFAAGLSRAYRVALISYAAANLQRRLRRATRGSRLNKHGKPTGIEQNRVDTHDIFAGEAQLRFSLDYLEAGPGEGPGTWNSVARSGLNALGKILATHSTPQPGTFRRASAVALPFRDGSVNAVVTDPPYYDMIPYADASDLFYVWFVRALHDVHPDLFGAGGLQDKTDEIVVKGKDRRDGGEHRTVEFYERMLSRAFMEAKRVLRSDGHLVVVFGHSDPDAWRRLLGALRDAGFVVTSSWPSRSERAVTGVASIKVTVTIGCRVAPEHRSVATAAQVDREVAMEVKAVVKQWDADGLALTDQLMAAYGPAMEVYGRYSNVLLPTGEQAGLERYLTLARTAVRDATALKLDQLPLETFDAPTRFAVFWQRLYGRTDVPKGEARFLAQADNLRLEDMRGQLLTESKSGFKLRLDAPNAVTERSSSFEVARAMAVAWNDGGTEAVATVMVASDRQPNDAHLWAVVAEIVRQLPSSDPVAKALTAVQRNAGTIGIMIDHVAAAVAAETDARAQLTLSFGEDQV